VQSTTPKANQQTEGKKKQRNKKGKGDKKDANNAGEGKMRRRSQSIHVIFAQKTTRLTYALRLAEAQKLLAQQQPIVLTNPFPQGKNMAQASTSTSAAGGSQGPPAPTPNNPTTNIYMMNIDAHLSTRTRDYGTPNLSRRERRPLTH
jgi:hypothetical protein